MSIKIYNFKLLFNVKLIYSIQVLGPWLWGNRSFFGAIGPVGQRKGSSGANAPPVYGIKKFLEQRSNAIKSGEIPQSTTGNQLNHNSSNKRFRSAYYIGVEYSTTLSITPSLTDSSRLKLTTKNSMLTVSATYAFIRTGRKILQQESGDNLSIGYLIVVLQYTVMSIFVQPQRVNAPLSVLLRILLQIKVYDHFPNHYPRAN